MNNRQAGRRRGRGGQRPGGNPGRPDNGNRIDNRSRGNAAQLLEKYKNLAADSQRSGDRVNTEYYLQFADHYFRVLSESRSRYEETRRGQDDDADDGDDFGYEGEVGTQDEDRDGGREAARDSGRDRQDRQDRGQRRERGERAPREDRGSRDDRPAREDRRVVANDADGNVAQRDDRPAPANDGDAPAPRRRGRPRRDAAVEVADEGFDVAILPPSIGGGEAAPVADADDEARPRRRRRVARTDEEMTPPAA